MHKYNSKGELVKPWEPGLFSVTTILDITHKAALQAWIDRVGKEEAERKRDEAAQRGDRVHKWISDFLKEEVELPYDEDMVPYLEGWKNWLPPFTHFTDIQSEVFLHSDKYGFAGSADIICSLGDEPWIIDLKTGAPQQTHGLQLKGYQQMYYEMTGIKARMAGLYLGTGTKKQWKIKEYKEPLYVFLAHKHIFDWQMKKSPIRVPRPEYTGGRITL